MLSVIKTDANGNQQWAQSFGGGGNEWAGSVQQTNDGGYIIGGEAGSFGNNGQAYLIKTDSNGNQQWGNNYGGILTGEGILSIQQTTDGGYVIAGYIFYPNSNNNWDFYLSKIDPNGNQQWVQTFGGVLVDYALSMQQTSDDGYIIAGVINLNDPNNNADCYVVKTDVNGQEEWSQSYGGNDFESMCFSSTNY